MRLYLLAYVIFVLAMATSKDMGLDDAGIVSLEAGQDIQAAIDALPTDSGEIRLNQGTWTLNRPIIIHKSNISLIGSGWETVLVGKPSNPTHWDGVMHIKADNIKISNMKIIHPFYTSGYSGVRIEQVTSETHENIELERLWITGERDNDTQWTWSSNIWIGSEHLDYYAVKNILIHNCLLDLEASGRHNILISSGKNFTIENNIMKNASSQGAAIWIEEGKDGLPIDHVKIINNIIEDDNTKVFAQDFPNAEVTGDSKSVVKATGIGTFINGCESFAQCKVVGNDTWMKISSVDNPNQIVLSATYPGAPYIGTVCRMRMSNRVGAKGIDIYTGGTTVSKDYEISGNYIKTNMQYIYISGGIDDARKIINTAGRISDVRIVDNIGKIQSGSGLTRGAQQVWLSNIKDIVVQGNYFEAYNTPSQGGVMTVDNCDNGSILYNFLSGYRSYGIQSSSNNVNVKIENNLLRSAEPDAATFPLPSKEDVDGAKSFKDGERLVGTYYFYWYDYPNEHFFDNAEKTDDALTDHFIRPEKVSYRSVAWHEKEIRDMMEAGIDFFLPVYWGAPGNYHNPGIAFSTIGIGPMQVALDKIRGEGKETPRVGLFYDTSTLLNSVRGQGEPEGKVNLTTLEGKEIFYRTIRDFFCQLAPRHWAMIDGRPIVVLYNSAFAKRYDTSTFEHVYKRFSEEFYGRKPYIIRDASWKNVQIDGVTRWGAALTGAVIESVIQIGPGYNDSAVPGRKTPIQDRRDGKFYLMNWCKALQEDRDIVLIETWNELHEGSEICETREYGRKYIEMTAKYSRMFKERKISDDCLEKKK